MAPFADPRSYRADLLEHLLVQSRDFQLTRPDEAAGLADLAISIAERIHDDPDTKRSGLIRARCLSANAYRLARLLDLAEETCSRTSELLDLMPDYDEAHRAVYCRTLALLRWDEGRLDEALALLRQASSLYRDEKEKVEWRTCSFLLALLYEEMGLLEGVMAAIGPFLGDWFEPGCRPWLTSRAMLTFAATAVAEGRLFALSALDEGVRFQGHVSDTHEQLRLFALEGRARARLGFFDEAVQMIEAVRRQFLRDERLVDLTLSSLDLLALQVAMGQQPGIDELLRDIECLRQPQPIYVELASAALDRFVAWIAGDKDPWGSQRVAATWYLQALRFRNLHPYPIPFA